MVDFMSMNQLFNTDDKYQKVLSILSGVVIPQKFKDYTIQNGHIYNKHLKLEIIPKTETQQFLTDFYEKHKSLLLGKSILAFYKFVCQNYANITRQDIKEFLQAQTNYQLTYNPHKVVNKPIVSKYPNFLHEVDLIDASRYEKSNSGYCWIYVQCDVFSRKLFLRKMKNKEASTCASALQSVLDEIQTTPKVLNTDLGNEFKGEFDEKCQEHGITHTFSEAYNPNQNAIVENRNKAIRKIIRSYMVENNTMKWYDKIQDIADNLNSSFIKSIRGIPNDLFRNSNERLTNRDFPETMVQNDIRLKSQFHQLKEARRKIEKYKEIDNLQPLQLVRVKMSSIFTNVRKALKSGDSKHLSVTYTPVTFQISKVVKHRSKTLERNKYVLLNPNGYELRNWRGNIKYFYASELLPINPDEDVETITMQRALKLNGCEPNSSDVIYE